MNYYLNPMFLYFVILFITVFAICVNLSFLLFYILQFVFLCYTCYIQYISMEFKKTNIIFLFFLVILSLTTVHTIKVVKSFKQLGQHHCSQFPIELLWRIASGTVSEKYGQSYYDYDCYIRQFIRRDGLTIQTEIVDEDQDQEQEQQQDIQLNKQLVNDPVLQDYALGLGTCLPPNVNSVEAAYTIWRFFRYLVQHDYIYEWMRAKIRATLGYEAQRPNSWMDGLNSAERLRLDKLFSNQFYEYVDTLMFRDFLYPLLTFFKQNTVVALTGKVTLSGKPMLFQSLQTHNYLPKVFEPVIIDLPQKRIFSYTIPGLPLLFSGSTQSFSWSFTGVLVDRSNIEEIETVGKKFYHHDTQEWLKLDSQQIQIPGVSDKVCKFMHSAYGPLYNKLDREGKNEQYIVKWHQKQRKVRSLFSDMLNLILKDGKLEDSQSLEFPFSSIVFINQAGVFQYICQQFYPSYFLYPDMFGQPEKVGQRLFAYPSRKIVVVSNSRLTTSKQDQYEKLQHLSALDEQIVSNFKSTKNNKYTTQSLIKFVNEVATTSQIKKIRDSYMRIYRKVKFLYLPDEDIRKKCDQLISILQKWNNNLSDKKYAPIFILWDYFLKEYTFNYVAATKFGSAIVKHRIITDNYWVNQILLWEKGTSYGECDSNEYEIMKHEVNGTGHNSSCYLNIFRAINTTRQILSQKYNGDFSKINLDDFVGKNYFESIQHNFLNDHVSEAFGTYYSKNVMFASQINNPNIIYYESYLQKQHQLNLKNIKSEEQVRKPQQLDEEL